MPQTVDSLAAPKLITLEQAIQIALSENTTVKVAEMEIERTGYARKGSYSALFPSLDGSASFQRTIRRQRMYMDVPGFPGGNDGIEVGRWNTYSASATAAMPLINAQLWKSLRISDEDVELSVEKARSSRLETVTQVKQAYFSCLLARDAAAVYAGVYNNAMENLKLTQQKYNAQKASELDLARAKTAVANAMPNLYDSQSAVAIALWQLKAVMGVNLDEDIDVCGNLSDYSSQMYLGSQDVQNRDLGNNSTLKQLEIQARQLADAIKMQKYASLPSLALAYSYSLNAMTNDFKFSEYKWSPYSYVGISLSVPIFAGGKRHNSVRQAKVQAGELELQRVNTERQLQIALRQYIKTMETSINSFAAAESAVQTAQKAYDIAVKSYQVGRSTLTDLSDAQLALTQAQLAVSQAVYNFVVAKSNVEQTIGRDFTE
ncbi:MAG: TolC family protein [Bacteroidales bacterium]|nr:TolC family protein [Bacteroidales bacterium]